MVRTDRVVTERPVTAVVGDIMQDLSALARAEARLAVAEATDKVTSRLKASGRGAGFAAAGATLAAMALGGLLAAAAAALSLVMAGWLAILLVALVTGLGAWLAISTGTRHLRRVLSSAPASSGDDAKEHR